MIALIKNIILFCGVIAILAAYGLSMFAIIPYQQDLFLLLNFGGAVAIFVGNFFNRESASFWSYVFLIWAIITALVYFGVTIHI